ncbi:SEC-C motif-containing protein [Mergibacter septicus]|uniref:YchJ family protein n=1 Tax=Mergibacter septicus TaxID=221402 RepID=UPI001C743AA0|nr:YchJ family protein [Mergibacter septicus]QDJ13853.1 SEC-C motif-containing protein [Mergibacter septicus]
MPCPCCSGQLYQECCQPFHQGEPACNAEQLMRSRYSAFVLNNVDYIINTTLPVQQISLDRQAIVAWSKQTNWDGLEIVRYLPKLTANHAMVEFNAYYLEQQKRLVHQELSLFVFTNQRWYFVDPNVLEKVSPKQPCLCGSGRKYKQCCGQFFR